MATSHWFIGGGVAHTPEMVRRDTYAKLAGAEGIVEPADLLVLPLEVTGPGVRVTIGSAYIKSRYPGAINELYMGSVTSQETISVPQNAGLTVRRDLVVMRVKDPYVQGSTWPSPDAGIEDPSAAESARDAASYVTVELITGVPAGTTRLQKVVGYENSTALTLARIDMPQGTSVLKANIVDLREVAVPRTSEVVFARPRVSGDDGTQANLTALVSAGGEFFPGGNGYSNEFQVLVPEWATRMVIDASWMSVSAIGTPHGTYWIEFGTEYRNHGWPEKRQYEHTTQQFGFNFPNTTDEKMDDWRLMDEVPVPAKIRGKIVTFAFKAGNNSAFATAHKTWMKALGGLGCYIKFAQSAIADDLI